MDEEKKKKGKGGRPPIQIDQDQFKSLCGIQCTLEEIASFFHCSKDTIERWCIRELDMSFADAYKIHSANGRISLRRTQFRMAQTSVPMAIFLGKVILGQREKSEVVISEEGGDASVKELQEYFRRKRRKEDATEG